ncbi:MAG: orotidine-5'-phosphate decarboxylase [Alphaproteobacteria bacterium]|nr:orotidine-5'-phosphate decarboxylase [Alphaproteobacteria bacterium]MBV8548471.1 orotidine-5'-phosphate decarboxylase [Alphaproteobacteria bacterium]
MAQAPWGDLVAEKTRRLGALCLGIDPVWSDIPLCFRPTGKDPLDALRDYVSFVLDTTADLVGMVKFQSAFFEAFGSSGVRALASSVAEARRKDMAIIMDAKRGDIGSTSAAYAAAYLTPPQKGVASDLESDCLTVNPFLGPDTLEPYIECARQYGKGVFILTKTSNPGSAWLQDQRVEDSLISDRVARLVSDWCEETMGSQGVGCVGAVVGATYPADGQRLRALMPNAIILAPGLGPQGGKAEDIKVLRRADGTGLIAPVSRGITRADDLNLSQRAYGDHLRAQVAHYQSILTV